MKPRTIPNYQAPDPHTTEDKAALCDAVAPFVTSLVATAEAQLRARADATDPLTLELARLCAREVNKLMRGEPQLMFLKPVRFVEGLPPASLVVGLRTLDAALGAFRRRYFGWHKKIGVAAWYIAGADGDTAAWRQLTRPAGPPPPGWRYPDPDERY